MDAICARAVAPVEFTGSLPLGDRDALVPSGIPGDRSHDPGMPVPGTDKDLDPTDFMMRRIQPSPYFRRAFAVDQWSAIRPALR